jgi:hypothetical protein
MSHADERKLQDFLDGRMTDGERAAFQERLERDPELAHRVEAYREIGGALRGGDEELSPGFYTRARARFESATAAPAPRRRWFRLVSWETAGLATAALLAMVLFLPGLLDRGSGLRDPETAEAEGVDVAQAEPAPPDLETRPGFADDDAAPKPVDPKGSRGAGLDAPPATPPAERKNETLAAGGEPAEPAGPESRPKRAAEKERSADELQESVPATPPALAKADSVAGKDAFAAEGEGRLDTEPSPEEPPARVVVVDVVGQQAPPVEGAAREQKKAGASRMRAEPIAAAPQSAVSVQDGIALAAGMVEPGAVRSLSEESWRQQRSPTETDESYRFLEQDLGGERRVFLIGRRDVPFRCGGIRVEATAETYELRLSPPTGPTDVATDGCALFLPRDGRSVVVIDPRANP